MEEEVTEKKTGPELIDEVSQINTLDVLLDRHPNTMKFPEDYEYMVKVERANRARWITAQEAKKLKKELGPEAVESDDGTEG